MARLGDQEVGKSKPKVFLPHTVLSTGSCLAHVSVVLQEVSVKAAGFSRR